MNLTRKSIALGATLAIAGCAQPASYMLPNANAGSATHAASAATTSNNPAIYVFQGQPDADAPTFGIANVGKTLYGTTYYGGASNEGALYSVTTGGSESIVHSFPTGSADGYYPDATVTAHHGTLYGTTYYGGANNAGTIFSVAPSGAYKVLYSFGSTSADCESPDSTFTYVASQDALYGVAFHGGADGEGCIFKYSLGKKPAESVFYSFTGSLSSSTDASALVLYNNAFYGTTPEGGANGDGAVFKVTLEGKESLIYSFKAEPDGQNPDAGLTVLGNALYGTTHVGGQGACIGYGGCGVIFKLTPEGKETVLYRFIDSTKKVDGGNPVSALVAVGNMLYGTAPCTGPDCSSVLFSESPSGGRDHIVYDFGSTASSPTGYPLSCFYGPPLPLGKSFYGTSAASAKVGQGTVWSVPR